MRPVPKVASSSSCCWWQRHHLSGNNLRSLVHYLEREDVGFEVTLQLADPMQQPELLELHRLVVTPALIKLSPSPKQVFAGSNILQQLKGCRSHVGSRTASSAAWD